MAIGPDKLRALTEKDQELIGKFEEHIDAYLLRSGRHGGEIVVPLPSELWEEIPTNRFGLLFQELAKRYKAVGWKQMDWKDKNLILNSAERFTGNVWDR